MFQYLIKVIGGIMTTVKAKIYGILNRSMTFSGRRTAADPSHPHWHASYAVEPVLFIIFQVGESAYNRQYRREHDANMPRGENFNLI